MPRKNPENRTAREEIAAVIKWAEHHGFDEVPAIIALRDQPTPQHVRDAILWANKHGFIHIATALQSRAL